MSNDPLKIVMKGHCKIEDDLGNVLLDKDNAIHSQNMARIISRAMAREDNAYIHRIAFGNGGTLTDAAFNITYNDPNDGQFPDVRTWDSRLYNEIYSEIIDDAIAPSNLLGTDPGSSGPNAGTRIGGGDNAAGDPSSTISSGPGVRSSESGILSTITITSVLNPGEPQGYVLTAVDEGTKDLFEFDEIGLYSKGAPALDSNGTFDIGVGNRTSEDITDLVSNQHYTFQITVDGGTPVVVQFSPPNPNPNYGQLCEAINTGDITWNPAWAGASPLPGNALVQITDASNGLYPTIAGAQTFGFLRFVSSTTGTSSSILVEEVGATTCNPVTPGNCTGLTPADYAEMIGIDGLNRSQGGPDGGISTPGANAGVQNDSSDSSKERERLLTHLVFAPVTKAADRTLTITYSIITTIARTEPVQQ